MIIPAESKTRSLDIPFGMKPLASQYGVRWDSKHKVSVWKGREEDFPNILRNFRAAPFSWEEFIQNQIAGIRPTPLRPAGHITPRPHQVEAINEIINTFKARYPGFLLADDAGLGKTITSWLSACQILPKGSTVCIVSPLSVIAAWRETIHLCGHPGYNVILLNYDRLSRLFLETATHNTKTLKGLARRGKIHVEPDMFLWDECQRLRNLEAARTKFALRTYDTDAKHIWISATAGQNPLELGYLLPLLIKTSGIKPEGNSPLQKFEDWCKKSGLKIKRGAYGKWIWDKDDADCAKLNKLLFTRKNGVLGAIRRTPAQILGWPELQRILHPVDLTPEQANAYQLEWSAFNRALQDLPPKERHAPEKGIAALTRFRQKASLLRVDDTVNFASDLIEEGHQVAISCQWLQSVHAIAEALTKKGIPCVTFTGQDPDRESNRKKFQTGEAKVIIFTVEEGINLQQNEILHDDKPRAQINHDIRWSAVSMYQLDHRCHRNGKFAKVYWSYATETKEIDVAQRLIQKLDSMATIAGDDKSFITELENIFLNQP